jgi:hypothetical protein
MSTNSKTEQIWNGVIEFETPAPDPDREAFQAAIEERLTEFRKHKEDLLSELQKAYERGPKTEPFDKDKLWSEVELVARVQHAVEKIKRETMGAAQRKARLGKLAEALTRARSLIEDVIETSDLAADLIDSWGGATEYTEAGGDLIYIDIEGEINKVLKGITELEEAATRASSSAQTATGRPSKEDTPGYIYSLAKLYRSCTGLKPGVGHGPFARIVRAYLAATGRNLARESVVEIIKSARAQARLNARTYASSLFED